MKPVIFYIMLFFCLGQELFSQREANIWYFGYKAGLDFTMGNPSAITTGTLQSSEACASMCDKTTGQLLFYSDAETIWNRNHTVMQNGSGLLGQTTTSQGVIFIPDPGNASRYYVFTIDGQAGGIASHGTGGLTYSIIDMTLAGGLGAVTTTKNVQLVTPTAEMISAVKHCNGKDYWIVVREFNANKFYAYLITATGIQAPVITAIGPSLTGYQYQGQLKFSPDGSMLAMTSTWGDTYLFLFNKSTGVVSNSVLVNPGDYSYGVEFSPDNTKLYVSSNPYGVYQFQINCGNVSGKIRLGPSLGGGSTVPASSTKGLQLGYDGRIYVFRTFNGAMDVILNPNNTGLLANYSEAHLSLNGKHTDFGSPNFVQSYFDKSPFLKKNILGNDTTINAGCYTMDAGLTSSCSGYGYLWSTGETTRTIKITSSGTYWVKTGDCADNSDTINVILNPFLGTNVNVSASPTTINVGQSTTINATGGISYLWQPNTNISCNNCASPVATPPTTTTYTLTSTDAFGCSEIDTITIHVKNENAGCVNGNDVFIPNAFSPNSDGENDVLSIYTNTNCVNTFNFRIYDRWGKLVFETTDFSKAWNGYYGDELYNSAVFYYYYHAILKDNSETVKHGNITLIR